MSINFTFGKSIFVLLTLGCAIQLPAQTKFQVPDTVPNYASYKYLDECIAAVKRETEAEKRSKRVWRDTLTESQKFYMSYNRNESERIANICLERVNPDTVSRKGFSEVASVLISANRYDEVDSMVARFVARGDSVHHDYIAGSSAFLRSRPINYSGYLRMLEGVFKSIPSDTTSGYQIGLRTLLGGLVPDPDMSGQYSLTLDILNKIKEITDTVPLKNKSHPEYIQAIYSLFHLYDYLVPSDAFDSLVISTSAFKNYLLGQWNYLMGYPRTEVGAFGVNAPDIVGDFWYTNKNSNAKVEKTDRLELFEDGKVTALYFVSGGCHTLYKAKTNVYRAFNRDNKPSSVGDGCWTGMRRIKEIIQTYPNINLVLVGSTFGSFGFDGIPLQPQEEADILAKYFLDFHELKGKLVVHNTEYMRFPEFDNRKIDSENPNALSYRINGSNLAVPGSFVLVDNERKIFYHGLIEYTNMYTVDRKLKAVMSRSANHMSSSRSQGSNKSD